MVIARSKEPCTYEYRESEQALACEYVGRRYNREETLKLTKEVLVVWMGIGLFFL